MLRSIDFSRSGMLRQQQRLDVIAQNVAAQNVAGFKVSRADLESGEDAASPGPLQTPSLAPAVAVDRLISQGAIQRTDNPFDLAIQGSGYFVLTQPDGSTAYTRDGSFQLNAQGKLVSAGGGVLGGGLVMPQSAISMSVDSSGQVSAVDAHGNSTPLGQIQLATFPNENGLVAAGGDAFVATAQSGAAQLSAPGANGAGNVVSGALESSNTDLSAEMSEMLSAQRVYQLNLAAFKVADQMLQISAQIQGSNG